MSPMRAERWLVVVFRGVAIAAALAVVPVFMPHGWMDWCHRSMGMGELPELPVIVYLTRSLSAMYVFHAGVMWMAASDVRRYAALVTYLASAMAVFGAVILWIDLRAGVPWFWSASEGPMSLGIGLASLYLQRQVRSRTAG